MKRYITVLSIIGLFLSCAHLTSIESTPSYDSIVTGQSDSERDVKAVQEAVDKGGTVLLKGTFDFGPKGRATIKKDVAVWGESDSNDRPLTKIIGGFWAFHSPLPSTDLPLPGPGPKIRIKNIHFDGVTWSPMHFPYTSGAEISGNTFAWNDIRGLKASNADFLCSGNQNTFIGPECKVVDKGKDNKILVMN